MDNVGFIKDAVMVKIKQAAAEQKLLQITYIDAKNQPSIRTIEPYEIKEGKLFGFCTVKDAIRAFNLDRIQSAELHLSEFTPRYPILL
jgi:predicted DNA-binding transcriptional regulator YafY